MPTESARRKTIRVLFISARADHGGGPKHMRDLVKKLTAQGYVHIYIASPSSLPYGPEFFRLAKQFTEIPHRRLSPISLLRILKLVKSEQIDVVHSHGRGAGLYSRLIGLFTKVAVVHTFHGVHAPKSLASRLGYWIDRALAKVKMTAIFVSKNERLSAEKFGFISETTRLEVIENGVDLDVFRIRESGPLSNRNVNCGIFLRDDDAKGPDLFLQLVHCLSKTTTQITWTCAGISVSALSKWGTVPRNLNVVDRVDYPAKWLQTVDFYFSTSRSEGQPLGVLEAMATGAICFLSEIPAHKKFLDAGVAIPLRLSDPDEISKELKRVIGDTKMTAEIQKKARSLVESEHSLIGMTDKIRHLYEELASFPTQGPSNK